MNSTQRLTTDKTFEGFDAEGKLALRQRTLAPQSAGTQTVEMSREGVFGTIDNAKVLAAAAFHAGLHNPTAAFCNEIHWLHNHTLTAALGVFAPPINGLALTHRIEEIDLVIFGKQQETRIRNAEATKGLHVPEVVSIDMDSAFGGEQMKRC